ncbi:putative ATP-dependent RNA Helicase DHX33 [Daphnia magna]|uniref:RNA helicase n=1 Tax=Daphnia magna TaxID=35525 RepID=A0A164ZU12_9CRUS|nr:putative ATP-dependent RNA Helicase DHX33 [Daphnia magna]
MSSTLRRRLTEGAISGRAVSVGAAAQTVSAGSVMVLDTVTVLISTGRVIVLDTVIVLISMGSVTDTVSTDSVTVIVDTVVSVSRITSVIVIGTWLTVMDVVDTSVTMTVVGSICTVSVVVSISLTIDVTSSVMVDVMVSVRAGSVTITVSCASSVNVDLTVSTLYSVKVMGATETDKTSVVVRVSIIVIVSVNVDIDVSIEWTVGASAGVDFVVIEDCSRLTRWKLLKLLKKFKKLEKIHHILIFLTGQEEIEAFAKSARTIAKDLQGKYANLKVCPLFANLPQNQQMEAFSSPPPNTRKVVLSTNIAETSVTIDGIRYVIDCGRVKARTHMPATGMDVLRIQKIAQAQAWQRAGRAGRQAAGFCYRAYTLNEFEKMAPNAIPEIQRCSLTTVVLQLLALGVQDPLHFDFMDKPPTELIEGAMKELHLLGGIQSIDKPVLTEIGQQMAAFPLDPRFTKLILASKDLGCTEEIVSIVALLSADSIMVNASAQREQANNVRAKFASSEGDHMTLLNIFRAFRTAKQNRNWCFENFVNYRNLLYAVEVRKQLAELCERTNIPMKSCNPQTEPIRRCLLAGLFLSVAEYQREGHYLTLGSRQTVTIHPSSVLFHTKPSCIVFTELIQTGKRYVRQVTLIDRDWIEELPKETLLQLRQTFRGTVNGPNRS